MRHVTRSTLVIAVTMFVVVFGATTASANHPSVAATCSDGADNDGDGVSDGGDPECSTVGDGVEDGRASCDDANAFRIGSNTVPNNGAYDPGNGVNEDGPVSLPVHQMVEGAAWEVRNIPVIYAEQNIHNANCIAAGAGA